MEKSRKIKIAADVIMLFCGLILLIILRYGLWDKEKSIMVEIGLFLCMVVILADLSIQFLIKAKISLSRTLEETGNIKTGMGIERLILLDEQNKPVKSWDMTGRTAMLIGRSGGEEDVDVDLEDCTYSSFIDFLHAVLNFAQDEWYVEDLGSQNGIKIRKVVDGECYKVMGRPCRVEAGDILYIANTRLLLS
jgi:hypothetical protein